MYLQLIKKIIEFLKKFLRIEKLSPKMLSSNLKMNFAYVEIETMTPVDIIGKFKGRIELGENEAKWFLGKLKEFQGDTDTPDYKEIIDIFYWYVSLAMTEMMTDLSTLVGSPENCPWVLSSDLDEYKFEQILEAKKNLNLYLKLVRHSKNLEDPELKEHIMIHVSTEACYYAECDGVDDRNKIEDHETWEEWLLTCRRLIDPILPF